MTQPFKPTTSPSDTSLKPYTWADLEQKILLMTEEQRNLPVVIKLTDMDSSQWYFATIHATPENIMEDGDPEDYKNEPNYHSDKLFATCILEVHSDYHFSTEYNDYCYFGLYEDK